ncbi:(2Fe-2S)-binding protein [bacterium]|nr:(2Fe-2S)-binding protein [bacterium]
MEDKNQKKGKPIKRRDFLKGFGGGAMGAAVAPKFLVQEKKTISTKEGNIPVYSKKKISLIVNGKKHTLSVKPRDTLLDVLREKLNLTGPKRICNHGECGGCTVLLDAQPVYSCMFLAVRADGQKITTVEGLAKGGNLHSIQKAFIEKDGYQCGFCTSGFIMSSLALLQRNKKPNLEEIKQAFSGNLCRCGNYFKIYDAVSEAAKKMRGA